MGVLYLHENVKIYPSSMFNTRMMTFEPVGFGVFPYWILYPMSKTECFLKMHIDGLHMTSMTTIFDEMCTCARLSLAESCTQRVHVSTFPLFIIKFGNRCCYVQSIYLADDIVLIQKTYFGLFFGRFTFSTANILET